MRDSLVLTCSQAIFTGMDEPPTPHSSHLVRNRLSSASPAARVHHHGVFVSVDDGETIPFVQQGAGLEASCACRNTVLQPVHLAAALSRERKLFACFFHQDSHLPGRRPVKLLPHRRAAYSKGQGNCTEIANIRCRA
jgi:hypothetical protein